jgi:hypothetical protein
MKKTSPVLRLEILRQTQYTHRGGAPVHGVSQATFFTSSKKEGIML